ncbi:polyphosphate kinase 1 [Ruminococcus flavefaciens]|uniref:polyphosphate kinase 1 n=1 Tax=Ruminococcus flavefaciens TaxID=1265 RepID=UPI0026EE6F43|nr:polyphosphate kinase 1 [Ruminococcus flavefaciens]MDD7515163.1 polyphosphate kinase 1 [Ruminococcus flavefaciens]MDY5691588.1 polyphosphate kinase 1 [Ruminococcus flavefaciens]
MEYLENRELSWLKFNKRVLEEAVDPDTPLLERLSFSAIYQSNLDEFFMVHVGSVTDKAKDKKTKKDSFSGMTPSQQLDAIFTAVRRLQPSVEEALLTTMKELAPYGFEHVSFDKASKDEQTFLEMYFKRELKPFISGVVVNDALPFPFLKNKEIYAVVQLGSKKDISIGIIPAAITPSERIIHLGKDGKRFILAEEVILKFAHLMFKNYKVIDRALIRVTRSADIMASGRGPEFRQRMEELVDKRKKLAPVRLEISDVFSRDALDYLCKKLKLKNVRVFTSRIPLDLSYLFTLQEYDSDPKLHYVPRSPRKPAAISDTRPVFAQVKAKDILLSYPFESINLSFIRLLQECANDPKVTSIKITLYRLARNSKVIDALCTAAENGKEVLVMIELRARFDEENNIEWSKQLQEAGVKVIYGPKEYKAHSKLLLITRKAQGGNFDYVTQIGTGNYNEKTASLYTDLMLLTADRDIAADAEAVFAGLLNGTFVEKTNKLLVSPLALRPQVLAMMDEQISIAKSGGKGYIAAKINSLNDSAIIEKLVEASQAGVKIELIVRGLCCLIAGVQGYTENITVRSIVGRFLEHSRIFIFGTDGPEQKIYIGSADYMSRNTIRRVEVAAPIEDERLRRRIREMFRILMRDNVKARIMLSDGSYIHERRNPESPLNSQEYFYEEAYKRLDDKTARQKQMKINRENGAKKKPASRKSDAGKKTVKKKINSNNTAKRGRKKNTP